MRTIAPSGSSSRSTPFSWLRSTIKRAMFSYTYGSAATKPEFGESLSESVSSVA